MELFNLLLYIMKKLNKWELAKVEVVEEKWVDLFDGTTSEEFRQFTEDEIRRFEESKRCCNPTINCPNPSEWCCRQCPVTTCAKSAELRAKYKELDDDFDNVLEEKRCSIAGFPICWKTIVFIAIVLLYIYVIAK